MCVEINGCLLKMPIISDHSIAQAIRIVGARVCRRLDALIEKFGIPPVEDIEGTNAPRKPLAHHAQQTPDVRAKKRGRPPKTITPAAAPKPTTSECDSPADTCEVSCFFFVQNCIGHLLQRARFVFYFAWRGLVRTRNIHEGRNAEV
jgi:hypothetical protein